MASPLIYSVDDKELDDAALWAAIDSAAAAVLSSTKSTGSKPRAKPLTPIPFPVTSPQAKLPKHPRDHYQNPSCEVLQNQRSQKISRSSNSSCVSEIIESNPSPLAVVKHVHRSPTTPPLNSFNSPETGNFAVANCNASSGNYSSNATECQAMSYGYHEREMRHSLAGQFPSVNLFKEYQNAAMAILEKSDYTMISGTPYIKKSGWRKISFYFNLSYEIKDKTIEFDENRNVQRAEFVVRAYMQGGRFSDGWGSCERREKRFLKPNHDIPSTAETRAKNKACQDLLGIGEYRSGASHSQR